MDPTVPRAPARYVDAPEALNDLLSSVAHWHRNNSDAELAVDTEADSLHHYYEKVCLIQITVGELDFVLDPLAGLDLAPLFALFADCRLLFHGADYDLRMLRASFGFSPRLPVFDTMLAAQLLGHEQIGMAALTERYFGVVLPKKYQRHDWSRRPLSEEVLEYARNDTRYLAPLAALLREELRTTGREEWHRQACVRVVASAMNDAPPPVDPWRVKGAGELRGLALAVLREIWGWRDEEARRNDRPPFMVLTNKALLDLAKWAADDTELPLSEGPGLPRNCVGRRLHNLEAALERGRAVRRAAWPPTRPPRIEGSNGYESPVRDNEDLIRALQEARDTVAASLTLSGSLLAPRSALEAIACRHATTAEQIARHSDLLPWQIDLLVPVFLPILSQADTLRKSSAGK